MSVAVDTSGRIYEDFSRLLFLHTHREDVALTNEIPEESEQFRFLHTACFVNIKSNHSIVIYIYQLSLKSCVYADIYIHSLECQILI